MAPTRLDLSVLPPLEDIKPGSILKLKKAELLSVALALNLTLPADINKINVDELKKMIPEALKVSTDVRFLKFSVHRPNTTGGAAIKNSVDKSKEDDVANKEDIPPSGANLKLLEGKAKSDPPAQHRRLANDKKPKELVKEPSSPLTSSQASEEEDADFNKPSSPVNDIPPQKGEVFDFNIKVNFAGVGTPSREVWILPNQRAKIPVSKEADGRYTTFLTKLVPAALVQFSPAKGEREYRLSIMGASGGTYQLGTMDQFLTGKFHGVLELPEANSCTLSLEGAVLICDLILTAKKLEAKPTQIMPQMKPLDIARGRVKAKGKVDVEDSDDDGHDWPNNEKDMPFRMFLNTELGGKPNGYGQELKTAGEMLVRFNDFTNAVATCEASWKSYTKGIPYRVPSEYANNADEAVRQYTNRPFKKADIERTLFVGHTIASRDRDLFKSKDLPYDPVLKRWVEGDPEVAFTDKKRFSAMTRKQFLAHLADCKDTKLEGDRHRAREERRVKAGKNRGTKKRPEPEPEYDNGSESSEPLDSEEERQARHLYKKIRLREQGKASKGRDEPGPSRKKALNSDHMDTD
ncbi:hypothetical protein DFH09DRAFT_1081791 [Mycena vulgaris]|nr:hypothetical protein DFH09DRAFT_1081791 [Mycena vulgaris]